MKKHLLFITTFLLSSMGLSAQVIINSNITTNTTWTNNNIYLLQGGCLYVTNNATLTIEPGTLIKGDQAALIVQRGAKIIADGTAEMPIVFTSSKPVGQRAPGDWGGMLIMGKAPINVPGGEAVVEGGCDQALYGGTDPNDNSGILRYVRIEYAGIPFQPNNELNSLTLGGVGAGTVIEHVQTSYGGDDAFEWFGGRVNGKWLVGYRTVDDIFDVDFGYQGKNQWLLGISDPNLADVSGSNGFETDNDAQGSANEPKTDGKFTNVSIFGPIGQGTPNANFRRALHIRRCSYLDVYNSVFTGFPVGLKLDGTCTISGFTTAGQVDFKNNIVAGSPVPIEPTPDAVVDAEYTASGNSILTNVTDVMVTDPFNGTNPNFLPMAGSPLQSGASFSSPNLQDAFFTPTTYRGAFGTENWTACWCEWDPNNANYDTAPIQYITKPAITAGGPVSFCQGGNVVLSAPAGFTTYTWSNGATTQSITVSASGNFSVTVTNARGCAAVSDPVTVTVNPSPNADFNFTVNGATVSFANTSTGATTYLWDFGDGEKTTAPNPSHTYSTAGSYNVCLTVTSTQGCTDTECKAVSGVQNPTVAIIDQNITTNTTWTNSNIYVLQGGCLYVENNATLTIQPGTVIRGEAAALIVKRGSKIIAEGTPTRPIVFTSNKPAGQRAPGDWGGLLIMGKAPINVPGGETVVEGGCEAAIYGGNDPNDNSGILRYVRIEFAGVPFQPNNELNSLTMGGVGAGTVIEHVMTSYGGDDAYEWFGGTVNGKWLIGYRTVDDIFDVDFGYSGKNQWLLGISDPNLADVSGSNGFETDNDAQGSTNAPKTDADFTNVTILGPIGQPGTPNANFRRALHIRRCSYMDVFNSAFSGFPVGFKPDGNCSIDGFSINGEVEFVANILAQMTVPVEPVGNTALDNQFTASGNSLLNLTTDLQLTDPFNFASNNPDFRPKAGSPLLSGANFSSPTVTDPFFTVTTYRGAMADDTDWTDCWTEWDPVNAAYTNSINYSLSPGITFNITGEQVTFTGSTAGAVSYLWDFGDGNTSTQENPTHSYSSIGGNFNVVLTVVSSRGCTATATTTVAITSTKEVEGLTSLKVFPNPMHTKTTIEFTLKSQTKLNIQLLDVNGRAIHNMSQNFQAGFNRFELNGSELNSGIYFLRLLSDEGQKTVRISVLK
jgi:PKD repeat protein